MLETADKETALSNEGCERMKNNTVFFREQTMTNGRASINPPQKSPCVFFVISLFDVRTRPTFALCVVFRVNQYGCSLLCVSTYVHIMCVSRVHR